MPPVSAFLPAAAINTLPSASSICPFTSNVQSALLPDFIDMTFIFIAVLLAYSMSISPIIILVAPFHAN
jgi:hypothetical protein